MLVERKTFRRFAKKAAGFLVKAGGLLYKRWRAYKNLIFT